VKVLLSVSLLGLFAFVDMGFAIVFLNFLLFNEAFSVSLCHCRLSAGSKKNASLFGCSGLVPAVICVNLIMVLHFQVAARIAPAIVYSDVYFIAIVISVIIVRLLYRLPAAKKLLIGVVSAGLLFIVAFYFFPKKEYWRKRASPNTGSM